VDDKEEEELDEESANREELLSLSLNPVSSFQSELPPVQYIEEEEEEDLADDWGGVKEFGGDLGESDLVIPTPYS